MTTHGDPDRGIFAGGFDEETALCGGIVGRSREGQRYAEDDAREGARHVVAVRHCTMASAGAELWLSGVSAAGEPVISRVDPGRAIERNASGAGVVEPRAALPGQDRCGTLQIRRERE